MVEPPGRRVGRRRTRRGTGSVLRQSCEGGPGDSRPAPLPFRASRGGRAAGVAPGSPWPFRLVRRHVRREIARSLDGLHVAGLDGAWKELRRAPLLLAANHVAWWDSFLAVALGEALGGRARILVDAANMDRFRLLERVGCIPVDPAAPRAGLRAGAGALERPGCSVWIFPQGRERPAHLRPLGFRGGVRLLARTAPGAVVVPVALQYAFRESYVPAAFAVFGAPLAATEVAGPGGEARVEAGVEAGLTRIDRALAGDPQGFDALVPSRAARLGEGLGARLLRTVLWRASPGDVYLGEASPDHRTSLRRKRRGMD